jgi:hypothetical protein
MDDYKLAPLVDIIERARPSAYSNADATARFWRLNALFVYFQYSVAAVRLEEASIKAMAGGQDRNFATHDDYEDCLLKLYSSAINAYSNLRTCLHFARAIADDIPKNAPGFAQLAAYRTSHDAWAKDVIERRNRIAAHPEKRDVLVWKPNGWSDDGRVFFVPRNIDNPDQSQKIVLHPRDDLEQLRSYISGLAPLLNLALGF